MRAWQTPIWLALFRKPEGAALTNINQASRRRAIDPAQDVGDLNLSF
jgi:hypothetical protein